MVSDRLPAPEPLASFLPVGTRDYVAELLAGRSMKHRLEVRISRPRRTKLGDHRGPARGRRWHRITVNEDLNPYAFLTTLLHEVAHATTWELQRGRVIRPHGPQWKMEFGRLLEPVVAAGCLPDDVEAALTRAMRNPAAATCNDRGLLLVLARYDSGRESVVRVEDLPAGGLFRLGGAESAGPGSRVFRLGRRVRTRYQCFDRRTGREYRVHALSSVEPVTEAAAQPFAASRSGISGSASRRGRRRPSGARPRLP